jgi:hypothetical protein
MPTTHGYVAILESETRNVSRIWFALTSSATNADYVKIGANAAWFTMNMEGEDRPSYLAQLSLLTEAMRSGLKVDISHGGAHSDFHKFAANDSFEVDGVKIYRAAL